MDLYEPFIFSLEKAAQQFKAIDRKEIIRVVSHLDADGICAAAIVCKALELDDRKYALSIVQQLSGKVITELSLEDYKHYIFTDLGSSQVECLSSSFKKDFVVLDHHETSFKHEKNINPKLFNIDSNDISGAGVAFLFARFINKKVENLAHLAIIGAIGDGQEKNGFKKLNSMILKIAEKKRKIKVIDGLRFFGAQTRPLYKLLQYSTDPFIPGVTGSEAGAISFLEEMGIKHKTEDGYRKIIHLGMDDMKKLAEAIVKKRDMSEDVEDILGPVYILPGEKEGPTRDAREFATLLNACGRLNRASLGVGACLNDLTLKQKAILSLNDYKRELLDAIKWYKRNNHINGKNYVIINAQDNVMPTIIGTLGSILSKSNELKDNTIIMSLAQLVDGTTKVSLRIAGKDPNKKVDLRKMLKNITAKTGGETGGHTHAAGAIIQTEKEKEFIEAAQHVFEKKAMEEAID